MSAALSRAGFRSFCKLMDMPESRAYKGSGCFLPGGACAIAVQSVLCQAKGECLAPRIVGSKKNTQNYCEHKAAEFIEKLILLGWHCFSDDFGK